MNDVRDDKKNESFLTELIKKVFLTGLGAIYLTDESIRALLKEIKLPKEMINYIVQQSNNTKKELFHMFSKEFRAFLETIDPADLLRNLMDGAELTISIKLKAPKKRKKTKS